MSNEAKIEKQNIRRDRLREIRDLMFEGSIAALANRLEKQASYVSRLLYPKEKANAKSIGEGIAREIEEKLGLEPLDLDKPYKKLNTVKPSMAESIMQALESIKPEELEQTIKVLQFILEVKYPKRSRVAAKRVFKTTVEEKVKTKVILN